MINKEDGFNINSLNEVDKKVILENYKNILDNVLKEENKKLKDQLNYIITGKYYNQLRSENEMLQGIVENGEISKEDKEFIDCTHRNTELLEKIQNAIDYVKDKGVYRKVYKKCLCGLSDYNLTKLLEILGDEENG